MLTLSQHSFLYCLFKKGVFTVSHLSVFSVIFSLFISFSLSHAKESTDYVCQDDKEYGSSTLEISLNIEDEQPSIRSAHWSAENGTIWFSADKGVTSTNTSPDLNELEFRNTEKKSSDTLALRLEQSEYQNMTNKEDELKFSAYTRNSRGYIFINEHSFQCSLDLIGE